MISWLSQVLGSVPSDYQFFVVAGAVVLVILCVIAVFQALFTPFRRM